MSKKSRRRLGGAERVGWRITSEVRWDQSHLIPLLSHQAPKNYFADYDYDYDYDYGKSYFLSVLSFSGSRFGRKTREFDKFEVATKQNKNFLFLTGFI